jgi:hypothetical protein
MESFDEFFCAYLLIFHFYAYYFFWYFLCAYFNNFVAHLGKIDKLTSVSGKAVLPFFFLFCSYLDAYFNNNFVAYLHSKNDKLYPVSGKAVLPAEGVLRNVGKLLSICR